MEHLTTLTEAKQHRAPPVKAANGHDAEETTTLFSTADPKGARRARAWLDDRIRLGASRGIYCEICEITPVLAEIILAHFNTGNRSKKLRKIERFAKAMRDGRWLLTHQGIAFSKQGHLNDGQNRLEAVLQCGRTVRMLVFFGEDREAFAVVDTGSVRGNADTLHVQGHANAAQLGATCRMLAVIEDGARGSGTVIDNDMLDDFLSAHRGLEETITPSLKFVRLKNCTAPAAAVARFMIRQKYDDDAADEFFDRVFDGDGLRLGDPRKTLREAILNDDFGVSGKTWQNVKVVMTAAFINAWNLYRANHTARNAKRLVWGPGETFPQVQ